MVTRLIGFYPSLTASDPEVFVAGVVEILCGYPDWIAEKATSAKGLPLKHKFMPTIYEIGRYCEDLMVADSKHRQITSNKPVVMIDTKPITDEEFCQLYEIPLIPKSWTRDRVRKEWERCGSHMRVFVREDIEFEAQGLPPRFGMPPWIETPKQSASSDKSAVAVGRKIYDDQALLDHYRTHDLGWKQKPAT